MDTPHTDTPSNSSEPEMMTCDWCGKVFPADARACVETGFDAVYQPGEGDEWKDSEIATLPEGHPLDPEHREHLKSEMGITDHQLDQLLQTGIIQGLGGIVCVECQEPSDGQAGLES